MNISFGILAKNITNTKKIVDSILHQNIEVFEIIIVGAIEDTWNDDRISVTYVKEIEEKNHITRKKNIIGSISKYDVIVMMKDYVRLGYKWYEGLLKYNSSHDFDILMNRIVDNKGSRYLDWINENPDTNKGRNVSYSIKNHENAFVPGVFMVVKKYVLQNVKFNECQVGLGKPTDVKWSKKALIKYKYDINIHSTCVLLEKHNRFPKFRKLCECSICKNIFDNKQK